MFRNLALFFLLSITIEVCAVVPEQIKKLVQEKYPGATFRIDDVMLHRGKQWLLIKPNYALESSSDLTLVEVTDNEDLLFSNNWIYTRIQNNTIKSLDFYPQNFQNVLLKSKINQEFVIPQDFSLPRDLAMIAGRLPIQLSNVELASTREFVYQERLKEEQANKPLEFLTYSYASGVLSKVLLERQNLTEAQSQPIESVQDKLSYVSTVKSIDKQIFISDLKLGRIFKLININALDFDATKPSEVAAQARLDSKYELQEFFALEDMDIHDGIKDFAFNKNKSVIYVLTSNQSSLLIFDAKKKLLIKRVELPLLADGLALVSRNTSEPDKLAFYSRSGSKVFFVNTFDFRISDEIRLASLNDGYNFVPHTIYVNANHIMVGVEKVNKKNLTDRAGMLVDFDPITTAFVRARDLDYIPQQIVRPKDEQQIYVLGNSAYDDRSFVSKVDTEDLNLLNQTIFDVDLLDIKMMTISSSGNFLLLPSANTKMLGVLDTQTWNLVKKITLPESVNLITTLVNE